MRGLRAGAGELPGVLQQVLQDDAQQPRVSYRFELLGDDEIHLALRIALAQLGGDLAGQRGQVHRLAGEFGAGHAREVEQVVDQLPHALGGLLDALQIVPALVVQPIGVLRKEGGAEAIQRP